MVQIREEFEPYISLPRAASFAVTIRIGRAKAQKNLIPEIDPVATVIDEIIDDIELINNNNEKKLREKIKDETYFMNFVGLTKQLSPDGKNVQMVGLTTSWAGKEKKIALTRSRENIQLQEKFEQETKKKDEKMVSVAGMLSYADAHQKKIKLTDEKGKKYKVSVPEGLSDIVKPYWEEIVLVSGRQKGDIIILDDIKKIE
jgi:hypothetical protein